VHSNRWQALDALNLSLFSALLSVIYPVQSYVHVKVQYLIVSQLAFNKIKKKISFCCHLDILVECVVAGNGDVSNLLN
jgi:hypothetical protein